MKEKLFHRLKDCILCCWQPVGVVGAITPWNFPLAMITRKVHGQPSIERDCILFQYVMVVVIVKKVLLVTKSRIYLTPFHFIN
jgi:hypothetical protein